MPQTFKKKRADKSSRKFRTSNNWQRKNFPRSLAGIDAVGSDTI